MKMKSFVERNLDSLLLMNVYTHIVHDLYLLSDNVCAVKLGVTHTLVDDIFSSVTVRLVSCLTKRKWGKT